MNYESPDGHIIESLPHPQVVNHSCECNYADGVYESLETTGSADEIGIQQIRITRTVQGRMMNIEIVHSSDEQLIEYKNQVQTPE
jgi:uncharacterized protein with FMN-binding domain